MVKNMTMVISTESLPTMTELKFDEWIARSWPYSWFGYILKQHMELDFAQHKERRLDGFMPTEDKLMGFWWRDRWRAFLIQQLKKKNRPWPGYIPNEKIFFAEFPDLRNKWEEKKKEYVFKEIVFNEKHGYIKDDFMNYLSRKWMIDRKHDFMITKLGLKTNRRTREKCRRQSLDYYRQSIVFCKHSQCWKLRWWWLLLPFLLMTNAMLKFYGYRKPEIFHASIKELNLKEMGKARLWKKKDLFSDESWFSDDQSDGQVLMNASRFRFW